jgi:hypothetical protein
MKGDKKVAGYVKRVQKYRALVTKYQTKIDTLAPLKRKLDAALVDVKLKRQTLTGGELSRAQRILEDGGDVMAGFDNRHED